MSQKGSDERGRAVRCMIVMINTPFGGTIEGNYVERHVHELRDASMPLPRAGWWGDLTGVGLSMWSSYS